MTNFIFKSQKDLQKISQHLVTVLDNLRWLRSDVAALDHRLTRVYNALALQKQAHDFYEESDRGPHVSDSRDLD